MINKIKKIILFFLLLIASSSYSVYALNYIKTDSFVCTETEEYKRWSNLSDKEKTRLMEPIRCRETLDIGASFGNLAISPLKGAEYTLSSFDLRNYNGKNYVSPVRSQLMANGIDSNLCLSFTTANVFESAYLYQGGNKTITLSPRHIDFNFNYVLDDGTVNPYGYYSMKTTDGVSSGGNYLMAGTYLAQRRGPILESKLPFSTIVSNKNSVLNQKADYIVRDVIYNYNNSSCNSDTIITNIKKLITNYGAIGIQLYVKTSHFSSDGKSYYYNGSDDVGHANTIIGWDDNYAKENFRGSESGIPSGDGAWIIKDNYNELGDNGYYYASYYTKNICSLMMGLNGISSSVTDNAYYYDNLGYDAGRFESVNDTVYYKQVFDKKTNYTEELKEINIFVEPNASYTLYYSDKDDFSKAYEIASGSGDSFSYMTIKLNEPVTITTDKFYVYLKYKTNMKNDSKFSFPVYMNASIDDELYKQYYIEELIGGVSYYSLNGDVDNEQWIDTTTLNDMGFYPLIHVFTNSNRYNLSSSTPIPSDNKITVKNGGYFNIPLTLTNIDSLSKISVKVFDSKDVDVTSSFDISEISNGYKIAVKKNVTKAGVYTVKFSYLDAMTTEQITVLEDEDNNSNDRVTGISITGLNEVSVNGTLKLTANVFPDDATNKEVYWSSTNTNIAVVDNNGVVTGRKAGKVKIYAISIDNPSVKVDKDITVVDINKEEGNGETKPINYQPTGSPNPTNNDISDNPDTGGKMTIVLVILVVSALSVIYIVRKGNVI